MITTFKLVDEIVPKAFSHDTQENEGKLQSKVCNKTYKISDKIKLQKIMKQISHKF